MKVIHVLNCRIVVFLSLFVSSLSYSQNLDDVEKYNIVAEYCAYPTVDRHGVWDLSVYRQVIPFRFSVRTVTGLYSAMVSLVLNGPMKDNPQLIYGNIASVKGTPWGIELNESQGTYTYDIYEKDLETNDSLHLPELFGKTYPLHWEIEMDMGPHKQKMVGDHTVYISGFCTEEQLKLIQERKKKREEVSTWP